ncbi:hypothetical protein EXIGLDRAFT_719362 [Exidia glandulosa HHB12029]|uniref:F-box domain-containing protein n=1 Tax=Exidia glandulosa HHB12029 TaxID=1314781 RepID=A0A165H3I2_EXIGL|nr:hypothetical protein EXIGLDRAFT_719362 [Exidia glandulosa HHB12029]
MSLSGPPWHELPVEIVLAIFAEAAHAALKDNVPWITRLSLVSRVVYETVTPILYETMVITGNNIPLVRSVTEDARRMAFVRKLCIVARAGAHPWASARTADFARAFRHVDELDVARWQDFISSSFRPRRMNMHDSTLARFSPEKLPELSAGLTHLLVAYPFYSKSGERWDMLQQAELQRRRSRFALTSANNVAPDSVADLEQDALNAMPALTHLALDMMRTSPPSDEEFNEDHLRTVLARLLKKADSATGGRIEVLALRVAGAMLSQWGIIAHVVTTMQDPRVRVWCDDRRGDALALRAMDIRTGRDVWTEARKLHK